MKQAFCRTGSISTRASIALVFMGTIFWGMSNLLLIQNAQAQSYLYPCPGGTSLKYFGETKTYNIQICQSDAGDTKLMLTKRKNRLSLQTFNVPSNGVDQYTARKGSLQYFVNPRVLKISENGAVVLKETMLRWRKEG
jgi:hypothetical protein